MSWVQLDQICVYIPQNERHIQEHVEQAYAQQWKPREQQQYSREGRDDEDQEGCVLLAHGTHEERQQDGKHP